MATAIYVENINKSFGDCTIFKDYSLSVEDGEFVLIKGQSGCGKSTLLNMIGLLMSPDSGAIHIGDHVRVKPYTEKSRKVLAEEIGWLCQNYALIDDKTVKANLLMVLHGLSAKEQDQRIEKALDKVGLSGFEKRIVSTLSGGEQQRVALARLLLKPARIILADEPTGNLDPENKKAVMRLLQTLQKQGKTIVVVSHDENLDDFADRIIHL